jgi:hypothetical protein
MVMPNPERLGGNNMTKQLNPARAKAIVNSAMKNDYTFAKLYGEYDAYKYISKTGKYEVFHHTNDAITIYKSDTNDCVFSGMSLKKLNNR